MVVECGGGESPVYAWARLLVHWQHVWAQVPVVGQVDIRPREGHAVLLVLACNGHRHVEALSPKGTRKMRPHGSVGFQTRSQQPRGRSFWASQGTTSLAFHRQAEWGQQGFASVVGGAEWGANG